MARVNSDEMLLNKQQQSNLFNMINSGSGTNNGGGVTINFNGPLLGDQRSAREFAKMIDVELVSLRRQNLALSWGFHFIEKMWYQHKQSLF